MKENFLHFLSDTPCSISINGHDIGTIDNINTFEQDILVDTEQIILEYKPISGDKLFIPYFATIKTKDYPHTDNEYIDIIPFPDNHYDIFLQPFYYNETREEKVLLNQNIDKYFVSITTGNNTNITIFSGASIVYKITVTRFTSASIDKKSNLLIIKGIINQEEYYLLVINTETFETIHNDISHSIEEDNTGLQSLKILKNTTHHAKVCKIEYSSQKKEIFYVYEDENIIVPNHNALIPLYFLEALSVNDTNMCNSLLSTHLQNTPLNRFKNYFGNIEGIYLNRHNVSPNINYTIKNTTYKNYDFIINNGKIAEIEEIF